jgi:hypothetical protein
MSFQLGEINYWAVLIAGLATFFLGGLWYSVLFGKTWVKLHGYTPEQVQEMKTLRPPAVFFGGMIVSYVVLAFVLAILVVRFNIDSALGGAKLGGVIWLGPVACIGMTAHIASNKPFGLFLIDQSFNLIVLVMMGAILGGWR